MVYIIHELEDVWSTVYMNLKVYGLQYMNLKVYGLQYTWTRRCIVYSIHGLDGVWSLYSIHGLEGVWSTVYVHS